MYLELPAEERVWALCAGVVEAVLPDAPDEVGAGPPQVEARVLPVPHVQLSAEVDYQNLDVRSVQG